MKSNARGCMGITLAIIGLMLLESASADETSWSCWHQDTDVHCVPAHSPSQDELESPYRRALNDFRQVEYQDTGKWVIIPLHSEPRNWGRVQMLVESVMCGDNPGCTIVLSQTPLKAALLDR